MRGPAHHRFCAWHRNGMWEFNRTIDGGSGTTEVIGITKCMSPTDDLKEILSDSGCKFSPIVKSGGFYSLTVECNVQSSSAQSGKVVSFTARLRATSLLRKDGQITHCEKNWRLLTCACAAYG